MKKEIIKKISEELDISEKEVSEVIDLQNKVLKSCFDKELDMFRIAYIGKFEKLKHHGKQTDGTNQ